MLHPRPARRSHRISPLRRALDALAEADARRADGGERPSQGSGLRVLGPHPDRVAPRSVDGPPRAAPGPRSRARWRDAG